MNIYVFFWITLFISCNLSRYNHIACFNRVTVIQNFLAVFDNHMIYNSVTRRNNVTRCIFVKNIRRNNLFVYLYACLCTLNINPCPSYMVIVIYNRRLAFHTVRQFCFQCTALYTDTVKRRYYTVYIAVFHTVNFNNPYKLSRHGKKYDTQCKSNQKQISFSVQTH